MIRKYVASINALKMAKSEHLATEDQNGKSFFREVHFLLSSSFIYRRHDMVSVYLNLYLYLSIIYL